MTSIHAMVRPQTEAGLIAEEKTLAVLDVRIKYIEDVLPKILVSVSVQAKWSIKYLGFVQQIESIKVEVRYGKSGEPEVIKNTAKDLLNRQDESLYPMIWKKDNTTRIFQCTFLKDTSDLIKVKTSLQFRLTRALPQEFSGNISEECEFKIKPGKQTAFIKLYLS